MTDDVLVVGTGLAGVRVAQFLRSFGFTGQIHLLGSESREPYDRPPLSKSVLAQGAGPSSLLSAQDLAGLACTLDAGTTADSLDLDRRVVHTSRGHVGFDTLVIATGARARRVPGVGGLALRTWDDAVELRRRLVEGCRLGVVGAGLIGCEVAASARSLGLDVSVIDVASGPLVRVVGPEIAELVARLHCERGVRLHMNLGVANVGIRALTLDDGTRVNADVVLEAVGSEPDVDWLTGSGLGLRLGGVACDEVGRTGAERVYAAGDCATWAGERTEHWTSAVEDAQIVAAHIAGVPPPRRPLAFWWSDQYGVKLQGVGKVAGYDSVDVLEVGAKKRPLALYSRDRRLIACVGFSLAGVVTRLRPAITAGTRLDTVLSELRAA